IHRARRVAGEPGRQVTWSDVVPPRESVPQVPVHVFGLDFSGGARAGGKIWLAGGAFDGARLNVDRCLRGAALPSSGPERERCLVALRAFIAAQGDSAFGCDFPFALPLSLMAKESWEAFVRGFAGRY